MNEAEPVAKFSELSGFVNDYGFEWQFRLLNTELNMNNTLLHPLRPTLTLTTPPIQWSGHSDRNSLS